MLRALLTAVCVLASSQIVAAATRYVDMHHPNCSNAGDGTNADAPLCDAKAAAAKSAAGDLVLIAPGIYIGAVEESSTGVTWRGTGGVPFDVKIVVTRPVSSQGWSISKTPGRSNIYEFSPGPNVRIHSLHEFDRPTDLNRRQPAAHSLRGSELNGVENYFAWHIRDANQSQLDDYFRGVSWSVPCPNAPANCEPPTLHDALNIVEGSEGSWIQDDKTAWGGSWKVYFHPRGNRDATALGAQLRVLLTADASAACTFERDQTTVRNLSCWGAASGNPGRGIGVLGAPAFVAGGDNSLFEDIYTFNGDLRVNGAHGMTNFTLRRFLAAHGIASMPSTAEYPGILVEDGEVLGRTSSFAWDGPWGTAASPAVFRRIVNHDNESWRFRNAYSWETDSFSRYIGTHGPTFGGTGGEICKNMVLENSVFWMTSDALRILTPLANVVIRNNTIRGGFETRSGDMPTVASVRMYNNIIFPQDFNTVPTGSLQPFGCWFSDCREIAESGHNLWFDNESGSSATLMQARDDTKLTLAQLQSLGLERNSAVLHLSTLATHFRDPNVVLGPGTGGDDYRLKSGSAAIDRGDTTKCAHQAVGACDVGAYEFGATVSTGPAVIHSESMTFKGSSGLAAPTNLRILR